MGISLSLFYRGTGRWVALTLAIRDVALLLAYGGVEIRAGVRVDRRRKLARFWRGSMGMSVRREGTLTMVLCTWVAAHGIGGYCV